MSLVQGKVTEDVNYLFDFFDIGGKVHGSFYNIIFL